MTHFRHSEGLLWGDRTGRGKQDDLHQLQLLPGVESLEEMVDAMPASVSRAAEKLRQQGQATHRIRAMVTTNHHSPRDALYFAIREVQLTIAPAD